MIKQIQIDETLTRISLEWLEALKNDDPDEYDIVQYLLAQAQQESVSAVYVLTAYDTEKERNGEVIVVDNREQAFEIEKTLQSIYGVRNVMFSSRKINDIPVVILEALQTKGQDE